MDHTAQYIYVSAEISIERLTSGANKIHTQYYIYVICSSGLAHCNTQKHFLIQTKRKKWTNCAIIKWLFFIQVYSNHIYRYLHIIIRYIPMTGQRRATTKYRKILNLDVFVKNSRRPSINVFYPIYLYTSLSI